MVIAMKDSGKMVKNQEIEPLFGSIEQNMLENGKMAKNGYVWNQIFCKSTHDKTRSMERRCFTKLIHKSTIQTIRVFN